MITASLLETKVWLNQTFMGHLQDQTFDYSNVKSNLKDSCIYRVVINNNNTFYLFGTQSRLTVHNIKSIKTQQSMAKKVRY